MQLSLLSILTFATSAFACADHDNYKQYSRVTRRQAAPAPAWRYDASYDWGRLSPEYRLCQVGAQQSPIALTSNQGLSRHHIPSLNYTGPVAGNLYNWGYGPAFTLARSSKTDLTSLPSMTFDNETVYMIGWHIHEPADHSINGFRAKAEIHFVHADASGKERAVLGIALDPGRDSNPFFEQLPPYISYNDTSTQVPATVDIGPAMQDVDHFNEFWTYKGSLTSPPCTEGKRWYVSRRAMYLGLEQMQALLEASTYSAREEQAIWDHEVNV